MTFFLTGGCALVSGRGEIISRTLPTPDLWIVLGNPNLELSTPSVYAELRKNEFSTGERTRALADSIVRGRPDWDLMVNGLQAAAIRLCPLIEPILEILAAHTEHRQLSGSGPTCFGLFQSRETAAAAEQELAHSGYWTWLGRPIGRWRLKDLELHSTRARIIRAQLSKWLKPRPFAPTAWFCGKLCFPSTPNALPTNPRQFQLGGRDPRRRPGNPYGSGRRQGAHQPGWDFDDRAPV